MAFDMQETNKVGFDMTKVKEGDKLVQRNGTVVTLMYIHQSPAVCYKYELSNSSAVTDDGCYWSDATESDFDIICFASENHQANSVSEEMQASCTFTEMQAVELLLSLGYTLKKGV